MSRIAPFSILLFLTFSACDAPPPPEPSDTPAQAQGAVLDFFAGIEAMDFDAIRSTVTDDFEIVEDTIIFDTAGFIGLLEPFVGAGATISYEFSDFNTEVSGSLAWTRYRNRAVMSMDGVTTHFEWVETAILQKVGGDWLVDRLHSVPVELGAEEAGH